MALLSFPHQRHAYEELIFRAETFFSGAWIGLAVRTRFHSLIVGPTGAGKSSLLEGVAAVTKAHLIRISCPGWLPLSGRENGAKETFPMLLEALLTYQRVIVFLDEIDKIHFGDAWMSYIRGEIFDLLDGILRPHLRVPGEKDLDDSFESRRTLHQLRSTLSNKLKTAAFIVGAGTFQDFFDASAKVRIGFQNDHEAFAIEAEALAQRLPRELINRFSGELICLPNLRREDYDHMLNMAAASLPDKLRKPFRQCAAERLEEAILSRKACRFVEETLLAALRVVHELEKEPFNSELEW